MVERYRPQIATPAPRPNRFLDRGELTYLNTGCTLLNCVISSNGNGGWPFGRVVNIVGDRSTGKTLLAEEAMVNFRLMFPRADKPKYRESEAAFDTSYYKGLGGNPDDVDFGPEGPDTQWDTIEQIITDIRRILDNFDAKVAAKVKTYRENNKRLYRKMKAAEADRHATKKILATMDPILYIVDSLDGLSSEAEGKRDINQGSYNLEKQKLLGELFRTEVRRMKRAKLLLIFISQIRDRIGPMIRGKKYTRTGGKALDFYASVVIYLSDLGKVKETVKGVTRPVGIRVKAKCEKNKITVPHRECEFELRFGYGIDDDWASLDFLNANKRLAAAGFKDMPRKLKGVDLVKLREDTSRIWQDIELGFMPVRGKYAKEPEPA